SPGPRPLPSFPTRRSSDLGVRQRDIEGDAAGVGRERFQIGADLVGDIAGRGGAVGAYDAHIDIAMLHQMAAGIVGDDRVRHAVADRKSTRLNSSHVKISYA